MQYAAQSDLTPGRIAQKPLAQLVSDANPAVLVEADPVVAEKLTEASGQIEMYCRQRYDLPLQPTQELVGITCAIALYLLYARRSSNTPDAVTAGYDNAMRLLRDVSANKASLDQPIGTSDQTGSGAPVRSNRKPRFSSRNLEGFE